MPSHRPLSPDDLALLRRYDTPTVCNVIELFDVRPRAAGLITSGAARDLDQVEALHFPCFADGVICAHGYCHIPDINVPVRVGGVTVHPGDLLHGDRNGVTTVPHEIAAAVAHGCAEYMAAEAVVLDYLKAERIDPKGYARARAECKDRIDALARKLKR